MQAGESMDEKVSDQQVGDKAKFKAAMAHGFVLSVEFTPIPSSRSESFKASHASR